MLDLLAIALGGVVTYLERVIFLIGKRIRPPKRALRYLPLVGPAVLGAIAIPGLVAPRGEISLLETVPALLAAVLSYLLWRWTKQMVVGLLGGLLLWWALVALLTVLGWRAG